MENQVEIEKETIALMLNSEESVVKKFAENMQKNLDAMGGPKQLFGSDLVPKIFDFLIGLFEGCRRGKSAYLIANEMRNPLWIHKRILRRRLIRKVFKGVQNYEENQGENTLEALLKTSKESQHEDLVEFINYIRDNEIPEVDPEPLYFPPIG